MDRISMRPVAFRPGAVHRLSHPHLHMPTPGMHAEFPGGGDSGTGGTLSRCGDNFVTGGEECEPPNTSVCSSTCAIIEPAGPGDCPACPDPADPDCPACPPPGPDCPPPGPDCPPVPEPGCGNDIIEGDEECEPPSEGFCTPDCKIGAPSKSCCCSRVACCA